MAENETTGNWSEVIAKLPEESRKRITAFIRLEERYAGQKAEPKHYCIVCPVEVRNLLALAHNTVVRWKAYRESMHTAEKLAKFEDKLCDLDRALESLQPLVDEHFKASLTVEGTEPFIVPPKDWRETVNEAMPPVAQLADEAKLKKGQTIIDGNVLHQSKYGVRTKEQIRNAIAVLQSADCHKCAAYNLDPGTIAATGRQVVAALEWAAGDKALLTFEVMLRSFGVIEDRPKCSCQDVAAGKRDFDCPIHGR
jgi:hypothetical protein